MKSYVIKDTIYNVKTMEVVVCYTGTDGYVHDYPEYATGYLVKGTALRRIQKEIDSYSRINEIASMEGNRWMHVYTIVEVKSKEI